MKEDDLLNEYAKIRECLYKNERYSVRDNGAVFRHAREGKRLRKDDNVWTFGKPNKTVGYMEIAGQRVHRIVAYAFLGEPPTLQHVVDHIDTNRRNNRPENLHWVTRLENVLNNLSHVQGLRISVAVLRRFLPIRPYCGGMKRLTLILSGCVRFLPKKHEHH